MKNKNHCNLPSRPVGIFYTHCPLPSRPVNDFVLHFTVPSSVFFPPNKSKHSRPVPSRLLHTVKSLAKYGGGSFVYFQFQVFWLFRLLVLNTVVCCLLGSKQAFDPTPINLTAPLYSQHSTTPISPLRRLQEPAAHISVSRGQPWSVYNACR